MNPDTQDVIAFDALQFAFSGKRSMPLRQHREIQATARQAKIENRESPGKRRSRFWNLGPVWGRRAA